MPLFYKSGACPSEAAAAGDGPGAGGASFEASFEVEAATEGSFGSMAGGDLVMASVRYMSQKKPTQSMDTVRRCSGTTSWFNSCAAGQMRHAFFTVVGKDSFRIFLISSNDLPRNKFTSTKLYAIIRGRQKTWSMMVFMTGFFEIMSRIGYQ